MSLYDDVDIDKKDLADPNSDVAGWSVGHRLLHSHTKSKKSRGGPESTSYSKKRGGVPLTPVIDLNRSGAGGGGGRDSYGGPNSSSSTSYDGEIRFNHITGKMESGPAPRSYAQFGVSTYPNNSPFAGMSQEYDPAYPNEYSDFSKRLKDQKNMEREEEKRREDEERRRRREEERKEKLSRMTAFKPPTSLYEDVPPTRPADASPASVASPAAAVATGKRLLTSYDSSSDSEDDSRSSATSSKKRPESSGAEFAPPPMLLEDSTSNPATNTPPPPTFNDPGEDNPPTFTIGGKGYSLLSDNQWGPSTSMALLTTHGSVASKIMAKMGYKHGSGLGRDEQGMSMALQVEKTSRRGGKIVHEKDITAVPKDMMMQPAQPIKAETGVTNTELLRNPTKVLLLMNMVGSGEVDEDLEPETAEECAKYGKVTKCVIYEMMNVPEHEAVRIFVEFEKISFAIKAAIDLNGRYFGGRVVRAAFYPQDKLHKMELADEPL